MRNYNKYDVLKILAIFLVVIGHVTIRYNDTTYPGHDTRIAQLITFVIYAFHMPLFMAISGSVFQLSVDKGKYKEFSSFVRNKSHRLLIPYLFAGIAILVPVLVWVDHSDLLSSYKSLLLGKDCRHLWYVLALFEIMIVHYFLRRLNKIILFIAATVIACLFSMYVHAEVYAINMAVRYYPYFLVGILAIRMPANAKNISACVLGVLVCGAGIYLSDIVAVDVLLNIIVPCFIVLLIYQLADMISNIANMMENAFCRMIANYSYSIYLFHVPVIYILDELIDTGNLALDAAIFIPGSIAVSIGLTFIIRKLKGHVLIGESAPRTSGYGYIH